MISFQVFPQIRAVRTRGPDGKIRTAGARVIQGFKDLGFRTAEMPQKKICDVMSCDVIWYEPFQLVNSREPES